MEERKRSDVKLLNRFFKTATKSDVDELMDNILVSERQEYVFAQYFLKKKDVCFIADSLCVSPRVISREIRELRIKLLAEISRK